MRKRFTVILATWMVAGAVWAQQSASDGWHVKVELPRGERQKMLAEAIQLVGPRSADAPAELQLKTGDRIVCIGDSITAQAGYLNDINAVLALHYATLAISNVVNAGISGHKAENLVARFDKDVLQRKPTIVTISIGINDVWHRLKNPHDDQVLQAYRENIAKMVDQAQAVGARVILLAPTVIQEDPAAEGNKRLPLYVNAMRDVAREKKCGFVDLHAMFWEALKKKPEGTTRWLTGDGVHMNHRGNAVMALGVLRALGVPDEKSAATEIELSKPKVSPADVFEACTFSPPGQTNGVLRYRYGKPPSVEAGKRYPFILCLHGAGERGEDNAKQVGYFRPLLDAIVATTPCYVVIPQVPGNQLWATYGWSTSTESMQEQPAPMLALTRQLLDKILAEESVDKDRIYVTGLSMGGYGTWEAIQRWPELLAAAVPVCGGGDVAVAPKLTKLPVWAWHGEADNVIKVEKTRRMIDAILQAGGSPKVTYIPGGGHGVWGQTYKDPELVKWLLLQRRGQSMNVGSDTGAKGVSK